MRKDIEFPEVKDVYVAIVREWNEDFSSQDWNSYIINAGSTVLETVIVVTKGYDDTRKTSLLRHVIKTIPGRSFAKIELIQEELFAFTNEFHVSFYSEGKLYDKKYIFEPYSIQEKDIKSVPLLDKEGVYR